MSIAGLVLGFDYPCNQCGATFALIVASGSNNYRAICRPCGADRGELSADVIRFIQDTVRVFGAPHGPVTITRAMQKDPKMNRDDLFPSKYLKAADLNGRPLKAVIESVQKEELKSMDGKPQKKGVVYFRDGQKGLVLNRTNYDALADFLGEETGTWSGKTIELFPDRVSVGGKTVPCIRVRQLLSELTGDAVEY